MVSELEFRRDTANVSSADAAAPAQIGRRIADAGAVNEFLPPVPSFVESQRMEIDLTTGAVTKHEARWPPLFRDTGELRKERWQAFDGFAPYGEVEVIVRPRLLPEQRVHAPAAVYPPFDAGSIEPLEDVQDVIPVHQQYVSLRCSG
jgi:hypothetical protein